MVTGGIAFSQKNSMENADREGARFGATLEENAGARRMGGCDARPHGVRSVSDPSASDV